MRILITGSRDWQHAETICRAIDLALKGEDVSAATIVTGGARGADQIAQEYGHKIGAQVEVFPADWAMYNRAAGPIRNQQMVDAGADVCLAFVNEGSKGAKDCATRATKAGIPTLVFGPGANEV